MIMTRIAGFVGQRPQRFRAFWCRDVFDGCLFLTFFSLVVVLDLLSATSDQFLVFGLIDILLKDGLEVIFLKLLCVDPVHMILFCVGFEVARRGTFVATLTPRTTGCVGRRRCVSKTFHCHGFV